MMAKFLSFQAGFRCFRLLRLPPRSHRGLACLSLALAVFASQAAEPERALTMVPSVQVLREGIFLDQIVSTLPPAPLPHLRVADAPALGQTTVLSRSQVHQWLLANAPEFATTNWVGVDRVRVGRRTRSLDEVEVRDMLRTVLQQDYVKEKGELEMRLTRAWTSIAVPDEVLTPRIVDLPATGPSANFIVRFELWNGEERVGNWQVSVAAKIWRELPVAQVPLRRGQLLADAAVTFERRDVLALRDAPGVFDLQDTSLELVENVSAGQPILARSVRQRPVVRRGELVDAVIEEGALIISLKVETLQDGLPGQLVRVRNLRTRRELMGKVIDERTILIAM